MTRRSWRRSSWYDHGEGAECVVAVGARLVLPLLLEVLGLGLGLGLVLPLLLERRRRRE